MCYANPGRQIGTNQPTLLDRVPFSFFLFGHVNIGLHGMMYMSHGVLFASMSEVVSAITTDIVKGAFEDWMERLEWTSQTTWDYSLQATL